MGPLAHSAWRSSTSDVAPLRPVALTAARSDAAIDSPARHRCVRPKPSGLATHALLLAAPSLLFFGAVAPLCAEDGVRALVLLAACSYGLTSLCMALAACSDPGFVPRGPEAEGKPGRAKALIIGEVPVNGVPLPLKYCVGCGIQRPLRAAHCRKSGRCVYRFDHYCMWLGNAVGRRNYPLFVAFVAAAWAHAGLVGGLCLRHVRLAAAALAAADPALPYGRALLGACERAPSAALLVTYCAAAGVLLTLLLGYHAFLVSNNQTTYEHVRADYADKRNPFRRSCLANWAEVFCECRLDEAELYADAPAPTSGALEMEAGIGSSA